jgi:thiol-disulfide isomerase/thioredoxin
MRGLTLCSLIFVASSGLVTSSGLAGVERRPPEVILAEIDAIALPPGLDPEARKDRQAVAAHSARAVETLERRTPLVRELLKSDPDHRRLPELLGDLWQNEMEKAQRARAVEIDKILKSGERVRFGELLRRPWFRGQLDEIDEAISATKNDAIKLAGMYWRGRLAIQSHFQPGDVPEVEEFIRTAPRDDRGAELLYTLARRTRDPDEQSRLITRILADYPASDYVKGCEQILGKLAGVGKPFDLEFNDATSGNRIRMKDLLGKVVVIEFWATWCVPCVDEMPAMKALYEKYRTRGVEFIGISLDRPEDRSGLDRLCDFVAANEIGWPQYYLYGASPRRGDSIIRGIDGVPTVFVVDTEGKLASVYARGKLDAMIPELLERGGPDVRRSPD